MSEVEIGRPSEARETRAVLWSFPGLPSMERCRFLDEPGGHRLEGTVLTLRDGRPVEIRYVVACDGSWATRTCRVVVDGAGPAWSVALEATGDGAWTRDGEPVQAVRGAVDVDLGFSPATNTLPIRRLALEVGESRRITAAWLRFPELELVRSEQVYTRLDERLHRYESGDSAFAAELEVDARGIVTRYGTFWRELADPPDPPDRRRGG